MSGADQRFGGNPTCQQCVRRSRLQRHSQCVAGVCAWRQPALKNRSSQAKAFTPSPRMRILRTHRPIITVVALQFRESLARERPSPQQWPHRPTLNCCSRCASTASGQPVIDCMRAYGAVTLGVVANVSVGPGSRAILGFISYGYAQMLLRLDRIEEYLLFLYAHRCHAHTRGSWTAGEVADQRWHGYFAYRQQTIPCSFAGCWCSKTLMKIVSTGQGLATRVAGVWRKSRSNRRRPRGRVNFYLAAKPGQKSVTAGGEPRSEDQASCRLSCGCPRRTS